MKSKSRVELLSNLPSFRNSVFKKKKVGKIYNSAIRARGLFGIEIAPPPPIVTDSDHVSNR